MVSNGKETHIMLKRKGLELISVWVPAEVMRDIRILLLDPSTGQIGCGRLKGLVTGLLTGWLEERKKGIDMVLLDRPPADQFEPFDNRGE